MKNFNNNQEAQTAFELAFGRILLMGSRPTKDGDIQEYARCKSIIYDAAEFLGVDVNNPYTTKSLCS